MNDGLRYRVVTARDPEVLQLLIQEAVEERYRFLAATESCNALSSVDECEVHFTVYMEKE